MFEVSATWWWTHHQASPMHRPTPSRPVYALELFGHQDRAKHVDGLRKRPAMQERQLRETSGAALPAAFGVALVDLVHANTSHWRTKVAANFCQHMSITEVRSCFNNCLRTWRWIVALENS